MQHYKTPICLGKLTDSWISIIPPMETIFEAIETNHLAAQRVYESYTGGCKEYCPEGFTALVSNGEFEAFLCFLELKLEKENRESIKKHFETYHKDKAISEVLPGFYTQQINKFFNEQKIRLKSLQLA